MGKSTISMAIFNSDVSLPEGRSQSDPNHFPILLTHPQIHMLRRRGLVATSWSKSLGGSALFQGKMHQIAVTIMNILTVGTKMGN